MNRRDLQRTAVARLQSYTDYYALLLPSLPPISRSNFVSMISEADLYLEVLEYLAKKGYSRTEAMLRKESAHTDPNGNLITSRVEETGGKMYRTSFALLQNWIDNSLDIYKPELQRILWPVFVHAFLNLIGDFYPREGREFFDLFSEMFQNEHKDDVRALAPITEPEHLQQNELTQLYRINKYRLTISRLAFTNLILFLEDHEKEGGTVIVNLIQTFLDVRTPDRQANGGSRGLQRLLADRNGERDYPAEDEGIPGHNPGSANLSINAPTVLSKLALGPMPMEPDLMEDVKAELQDLDGVRPPAAGQNSLVDEFEQRIKHEPMDDVPSREALPFPPSTARDVAMEVQKVKENRDRFRVEGRTGGVGPGISVTMFTFHNTFDSMNCIEFSGDNTLVAVGTAESYIRVWSLDNRALTSPADPPSFQPSSSRRLVGHSGPVYALSFSPTVAVPPVQVNGFTLATNTAYESQPRYLLSSSADSTIRLWSLDTWTNLVVYRGHQSPVWDVRFCPHGHYFVSASADRTARLWSTPQIGPLRLFTGHDSDVETVAWHPNGAYVFTGGGNGDRTVRMWDIVRGTSVRIFTGHVGNVTALACAPNGHVVASADDRGEIILWSLPTGRLIKRMRGHGRGGIWSLDWSVESSVLVSGGADGTVRVWDVQPNKDSNGKVVGEGGAGTKIDGSATNGAVTKTVTGKAKKDVIVSPDQISAFPTKKSPVYKVKFTLMNLVMAGGAYLP